MLVNGINTTLTGWSSVLRKLFSMCFSRTFHYLSPNGVSLVGWNRLTLEFKAEVPFTSCVILEWLFDSSKLQFPTVDDRHENSRESQ